MVYITRNNSTQMTELSRQFYQLLTTLLIIGNPREKQAKNNLAKEGVEEVVRDGSGVGRGTDQSTGHDSLVGFDCGLIAAQRG